MSDEGQPLDPEHIAMLSNAGRCDIFGKPIDMSSGDRLTVQEFDVPEDVAEEYGLTAQDAADAVADALESVGDSGADYELAAVIRGELGYKAHAECLDEKTAFDKLTVSEERAQELTEVTDKCKEAGR